MSTISININQHFTNCKSIVMLSDTLIYQEAARVMGHYFAFISNKLSDEFADHLLSQSVVYPQRLCSPRK